MTFTSYAFIAFAAVVIALYYLLPARFQWMFLLCASIACFLFSPFVGLMYWPLRLIGYCIDVRRGVVKPEKNIAKLLLFLLFFPLAPTGPVTRYGEMSETLFSPHTFDADAFLYGLFRVLFGFFKKLVIADRIGIAVQALSADPARFPGAYVLFLMVFYTTQLYADFTGGIDIALGLCEMFGIRAPENFNSPYSAKTLSEFWTRWHITLGAFFRDYVFFPITTSDWMNRCLRLLSGDGKEKPPGKIRLAFLRHFPVAAPTLIVWFLTGLWHGVRLHFVMWGLLNGIIILLSRLFAQRKNRMQTGNVSGRVTDHHTASSWKDFLRILRTLFIVSSLRLLDCYQSVPLAFSQFVSLFTPKAYAPFSFDALLFSGLEKADYLICTLAVLFVWFVSHTGGITQGTSPDGDFRARLHAKPYALRAFMFAFLFLATLVFGIYGTGYDAAHFIYARF